MISLITLLNRTLQDYRQQFFVLFGTAAWLLIPFLLLIVFAQLPPSFIVDTLTLFLSLIQLFLLVWITVTLFLYIRQSILGLPGTIPQCSAEGRLLVAPFVWALLLLFGVLIGGTLLLVVPGFLFFVWFGLTTFIVIFEKKRPLEAMQASREYVRGQFWQSARLLLLGPLIIFLSYSFVMSVFISLVARAQGTSAIEALTAPIPIWVTIAEIAGETLLLPFFLLYLTHVYLVLTKNGTHLEKPAEIA